MPSQFDPFTGPPTLQPWQRGLIGAIPFVGPAYNTARLVNAAVQYIRNHTGNGTDSGGLPITSETNNPPMYGGSNPGLGNYQGLVGQTDPTGLPITSETNNPPMYGQTPAPQPGAPARQYSDPFTFAGITPSTYIGGDRAGGGGGGPGRSAGFLLQ